MSQDKCLEPSKKKLDKAKKEGKVAYSKELTSLIQISICILTIKYLFGKRHYLVDLYHKIFIYVEQNNAEIDFYIWLFVFRICLLSTVLIVFVVCIATFCAEYCQKGLILSFSKIKPAFENINPAAGLKRILQMQNGEGLDISKFFFEIVYLSLLCIGVGIIIASLIYSYFILTINADPVSLNSINMISAKIIEEFLLKTSLILCCLSIIKFLKSKYDIRNELRMTIEEYRKELKEEEGDPYTKGERKAIHREISINNILENVRKASLIITD